MILLAALLAAIDPHVQACVDDDAAACFELGKAARQSGEEGSSSEARLHFMHGCELGHGDACLEAAALAQDADAALALKDRGDRLNAGARMRPDPPLTAPLRVHRPGSLAAAPSVESAELGEHDTGDPRGSRFGVIAVVEGKAGTSGVAALAGMGMRVGFRERTSDEVMFMPAGAMLGGAEVAPGGFWSGWIETRVELMGARHGGTLQPAIHGYFSGGVSLAQRGYTLSPLGGSSDSPLIVRPYFGTGGGWNWVPQSGGGGGGGGFSLGGLGSGVGNPAGLLAVVVIAIAAIPLILAGRIEVRVLPPILPGQQLEVFAVTGFGF